MAEKHSEHIGFNYLSKLLNIKEYNTTGNKELFGSKIPDGWLLVGNSLLIIEYKSKAEMKKRGYSQLAKYSKLAITNKPELTIYCMLGLGTDVNTFEKIFMLYTPTDNHVDDSMKIIDENKIKAIFSNVSNSVNYQSIHNMLVNCYKFENAKDLHDILTIICVSILDDKFRKYYEVSEDKVDEEFVNNLVNLVETKITDSTVNYKHILEAIKRLPFRNSFSICKTIYNSYKANPKLIGQLFQQFKKYNDYIGSNNEIWTPPIITELMYNIGKKYANKDKITILDPCIGFNALIYPWIQNNVNIIVKGCEISSRLYFMGKLDLMIKGISEPLTYCKDFMTTNEELLKADICVCNPPYTRNISNGYDCLDFVNKSVDCAKTSIFIFPKSRLINNKQLKETFLKKAKLLEIIELGNNIFKGVNTGDIIIIVCQKMKDKNKDIKTKYYNLSAISKEFKNIPHSDGTKLTEKGKQTLSDYVNGVVEYIEYTPTVDNIIPIEEEDKFINVINDNLNKNTLNVIQSIDKLSYMSQESKNKIMNIILEEYEKYTNDVNLLEQSTNNNVIDVRFGDVFELVKHKTTDKRKHNSGIYPFVHRTQFNNGVDDYLETYTEDTEDNIFCIADLNGYASVHTGKFSIGDHMVTVKLTEKYKHLDVNTNVILLRGQLMSSQWKYNNLLTYNKIKDKTIKVYIKEPLFKHLHGKVNKLQKFKLMDIFEQVKFKSSTINDSSIGDYPLFGASKDDEPVKYIDKYTIDTKGAEWIQLNKNGSVGYCFVRFGKFTATQDIYILKPKDEYIDYIDLNINTKILTLQLTNMGFGFGNKINNEKLNALEVYILMKTA